MRRRTPIWVWVIAALGLLCLLLILDPFAVEVTGYVLLGLYVFAFALVMPLLAILAYLDMRRVARESNHVRWETIDVLWVIVVFAVPIAGPLLWFYAGRPIRVRERGCPNSR